MLLVFSVLMTLGVIALLWGMVWVQPEEWHLRPEPLLSVRPAHRPAVNREEAAALLGVSPTAPAHVVEAALQARLEAQARAGLDEARWRALVASRDALVPWRS